MNPDLLIFHPDVKAALASGFPVLALETSVFAQGLPSPDNLELAIQLDQSIRSNGVVPAPIAIIDGKIHLGLSKKELEHLCTASFFEKAALRDIGRIVASELCGATTVSSTIHIAHQVGIRVFTTGGIGGVHRKASKTFDVSQDLLALSRVPIVTVSSGVKSILDLSNTLEMIEALSIPVLGYKTNTFPAFYSAASGFELTSVANNVNTIVKHYMSYRALAINSALLVVNPVPKKDEIPFERLEPFVNDALLLADQKSISGKDITPFLLKTLVETFGKRCVTANRSLVLNNALLGTRIAKALSKNKFKH